MENNDLFDFEIDNYTKCWNVTRYYGKGEEVIFPESYQNKPVKKAACFFSPDQKKRIKRVIIPEGYISIGENTFSDCTKLTNIELPESLTSIGSWAFLSCKGLTSIKLPKNLTFIGIRAFGDCRKLKSIELPKNLSYIGPVAFSFCTGLTEINVDEKNPVFCSVDGVLFNKAMTTLILCPEGRKRNYSVPDGIRNITKYAFHMCKYLKKIVLPESLKVISDSAFEECKKLKIVTIPMSLKYIGENAFEGCTNLKTVTLSRKTKIGHNAFNGFKGRLVYID